MRTLSILVIAMLCVTPLFAEGFFEITYGSGCIHSEDFDALLEAPSVGFNFGYDTAVADTGIFFDLELGYEVSTHEIDGEPSERTFRNHRGFIGGKIKYGGLGYVEPYVGFGVMAYTYYEASDAASAAMYPDFEIDKNLSGSYLVYGIDFFFNKEGWFALGVENRTMEYSVVDPDNSATTADAAVERLAFKMMVLF